MLRVSKQFDRIQTVNFIIMHFMVMSQNMLLVDSNKFVYRA